MENDNNVNGNLNDNSVLDALVLTREQWRSGIIKAVIFTLIAVIIFFVPVTVRGSTDVTFGIIYKNIKAGLGLAGLWMGGIIIMETARPAYKENISAKTRIQLFTGIIRRIRCCIRCFTCWAVYSP